MVVSSPLFLDLSQAQVEALHEHQQHLMGCFEQGLPVQRKRLNQLQPLLREILFAQEGFAELHAQAEADLVQVQLQHSDEAILSLPWSAACLDRPQLQFELGGQPAQAHGAYRPTLPLPLKVLVMVSGPEDGGPGLSFEEEEALIIQAFGPLLESGQVQIDYTDDGSLASLQAKLAEQAYHVLHFSGHGSYRDGQGYLLLEHPDSMAAEVVSAADFGRVIAQAQHTPPLVLLSACQSGQAKGSEGYRGVAQALLSAGVPSVIGMRHSVRDQAAITLAHAFYQALSEEQPIPMAFHRAILALKQQDDEAEKQNRPLTAQWLIPQLFMGQPVEQIVDWQAPAQPLQSESVKYLTDSDNQRLLLEAQPNYRFIGRRRERKEALASLNQNQPVLLRGMGGVGKTALAEHLVLKLISAEPRTQLFFLNEKPESRSLDALLEQMLQALEAQGQTQLRAELTVMDEHIQVERNGMLRFETLQADAGQQATLPERKLWRLLAALSQCKGIRSVFVFDNLETFQTSPGEAFSDEFGDVLMAIQQVVQRAEFPVILTCRYPLAEFPEVATVNLNQVSYPDLYKKVMTSNLRKLPGQLAMSPQLFTYTDSLTGLERTVRFPEVVERLHRTLGGNYRVLELFDAMYQADQGQMLMSLRNLEEFERKLAGEYREGVVERLQTHARKVVFEDLYGLLSEEEKRVLHVLAGFRVPVTMTALCQQIQSDHVSHSLLHLHQLTLIEEGLLFHKPQSMKTYYVTPLVKEMLGHMGISHGFHHQQAGQYFDALANEMRSFHQSWKEAFWHYLQAKDREKVNEWGTKICDHYDDQQILAMVCHFGKQTEIFCEEQTNPSIMDYLGRAMLTYGELEAAKQHFEQVLAFSEESDHLAWKGQALNNLSQIYKRQGEYDLTRKLLQESLSIKIKQGDAMGRSNVLNNLAMLAHATGDYPTAHQYLVESLQIDRQHGTVTHVRGALSNLGCIAHAQGDFDSARDYLEQALEAVEKDADPLGRGTILNNLATIYHTLGQSEVAMSYLEQALVLQRQTGDRQIEGLILNNIGQVHKRLGKYERALAYFNRSLAISRAMVNPSQEANTLNNISQVYDEREEYERASEFLDQSLQIQRSIHDLSGEATTLNNLAGIAYAEEKFPMAIQYYTQSLTIQREIGDQAGMGLTLNNLGQTHKRLGNLAQAIHHFQLSLQIRSKINDPNGLATTLYNLGVIRFNEQNQPEKALPLFLKAFSIWSQMASPHQETLEWYISAILQAIGKPRFEEILAALIQGDLAHRHHES